MLNQSLIVKKEVLYWGQPEFASWLETDRQDQLLNLEVSSWLSDLYWGEFLALRYARLRLQHAPPHRKKIWERISFDEMAHFSLINQWFIAKRVLPELPNPLLKRLISALQHIEDNVSADGLRYAEEIQLFLESLIHKLIDWRLDSLVDSQLREILIRVNQDELVHIHATVFEAKDLDTDVILRKYQSQLFPLHFARRILSREEFRKAHTIGLSIVQRRIFGDTNVTPPSQAEGLAQ